MGDQRRVMSSVETIAASSTHGFGEASNVSFVRADRCSCFDTFPRPGMDNSKTTTKNCSKAPSSPGPIHFHTGFPH
eukprot:scaffold7176_cov134-Cylindrotheca_fusiformis.AAC.4